MAATVLAAGASIATSQLPPDPVRGLATSPPFELTAALPVRTFNVTVDVNAAANANSNETGQFLALSIVATLSATTTGGAEVTATMFPDDPQPKGAVITGQASETLSLEAPSGFFAGCQARQPCVRQGTVRLALRSGAGARGSFQANAEAAGWIDDPPADAAVKVTITEKTP